MAIEHTARGRGRGLPPVIAWLLTSLFVCLAWIPFRASNLDTAWAFAKRLVAPGPSTLLTPAVAVAIAGVLAVQLLPERPLDALRERLVAMRPVVLGTALAVTVAIVSASVPGHAVPPFIYFQF
jgi:hypothetical protein